MFKLRIFVSATIMFFIIIVLSGCTATQYRARDFFGEGYTEARIAENTYNVDFRCNELTSEMLCEGHLFRRCAELTINAGYDYFIMENHSSYFKEENTVVPGHYNTVTTGSGKDKTTTMVFQPGYVVKNQYPVSKTTIRMFKGSVPKNEKNVYNPREIMKYVTTGN